MNMYAKARHLATTKNEPVAVIETRNGEDKRFVLFRDFQPGRGWIIQQMIFPVKTNKKKGR